MFSRVPVCLIGPPPLHRNALWKFLTVSSLEPAHPHKRNGLWQILSKFEHENSELWVKA